MQNTLIKIHKSKSFSYNPTAEQTKKEQKRKAKQLQERREQKRSVE